MTDATSGPAAIGCGSPSAEVRAGVFPGSFDPLTTAHVAIAEAAVEACALDRLDLVMSTVALAKSRAHSSIEERIAAIERLTERIPQVRASVTDRQLLADIAEAYDVLVVGADKWHQLRDVGFYGSVEARDDALARLPEVVLAPRGEIALPAEGSGVIVLALDPRHLRVSSTAVRAGRTEWRA